MKIVLSFLGSVFGLVSFCFVIVVWGFVCFFPRVLDTRSFGASSAIYHKTSCRAETWDVQGKINKDCHPFWFVSSCRISEVPLQPHQPCVNTVSMIMSGWLAPISNWRLWFYCVLFIKFLLGLMLASGEITVEYLSWTCLIPLHNPLYQHTVHSNAEHTSQQGKF